MPTPESAPPPDWTTGPAKWAAVLVLGIVAAGGMAWSLHHGITPPSSTHSPAASAQPSALHTLAETASTAPTPPQLRKINLNTATTAELELLPGVGPTVALRIAEFRKSSGPFQRIEDLDRVQGIGPRTLDKLRELVTVD